MDLQIATPQPEVLSTPIPEGATPIVVDTSPKFQVDQQPLQPPPGETVIPAATKEDILPADSGKPQIEQPTAADFFPEAPAGELEGAEAGVGQQPQPASDEVNKIGRPKGSRNKPKLPDFSDVNQMVDPTKAVVNYGEMSQAIFILSTNTLSAYFGPEWQPQNKEEQKMVVDALAVYLRSKEVKDIPPGVLLAILVSSYCAPRIMHPNTRGKLSIIWSKIKLGWQWLWLKIGSRKKRN